MENKFDINTIKVIIGLGNPGAQYARHRHSIGFRVLDLLASRSSAEWRKADKILYTTIRHNDHDLMLIKPQTFMNDSGKAMPALQKKGIKPEQVLVVHDELEKKFGLLTTTLSGSSKGHNGLKSIMGQIGAEFWRLKFGIGRPGDREDVPNYVLSNFPPDEEAEIPQLLDACCALLGLDK